MTGDVVGQVASQTLENLAVVGSCRDDADLPAAHRHGQGRDHRRGAVASAAIRSRSCPTRTAARCWCSELALGSGNEVALTSLSMQAANIASARGDVASSVRFSEEALEHARKTSSKQLLAVALGYVADAGLRTGDFRASLRYSEEALAIAKTLRRNGLELTTRFNMGMAKIGLGDAAAGKKL